MALSADMETTEYEFAISPSALDIDRLKPPTVGRRLRITPRSPIPARCGSRTRIITWSRRSAAITRSSRPTSRTIHSPRITATTATRCSLPTEWAGWPPARSPAGSRSRPRSSWSTTRPSGASRSTRKKLASSSSESGITCRRSMKRSPRRSEADHRLFGMGTTLTVAYSVGVDLFIIHLGDSRAYLFRQGPSPASDQGPHRRPGHGRRRLHRTRGGSPPPETPRAHQFPGRPSR